MGNAASAPQENSDGDADTEAEQVLGMLVLAEPADAPPLVDVVFVHGLNGGARSTWTSTPASGIGAPVLWPKEWLGAALPRARVLSFGYPNGMSFWAAGAGRMSLQERATNFLFELRRSDVDVGRTRPVVFLGHSMGGLVIKQALVLAYGLAHAPSPSEYHRGLLAYTRGCVFFGTPHRGAALADWMTFFGRITRASPSVDTLRAFSEPLLTLNKDFLALNVPSLSFAEKVPVAAGVVVVPKESADMGVPGHDCVPVDYDHFTVCKPSSRRDLVCQQTIDFVREQTTTTA